MSNYFLFRCRSEETVNCFTYGNRYDRHYGNTKKLKLGIKTFATQNVNHILRQIDDIMRVKQKYRRLSKEDIDKQTKDAIISWINENV